MENIYWQEKLGFFRQPTVWDSGKNRSDVPIGIVGNDEDENFFHLNYLHQIRGKLLLPVKITATMVNFNFME